jgi:hypothetical protein
MVEKEKGKSVTNQKIPQLAAQGRWQVPGSTEGLSGPFCCMREYRATGALIEVDSRTIKAGVEKTARDGNAWEDRGKARVRMGNDRG